MVLESETQAQRGGRRIYAELVGAGVSSDGYHPAPDPSGAAAARAMQLALSNAEDGSNAVVHLNAHATSTPQGDAAEATAIHATFGRRAGGVAVTATKSMTGHLLGGGIHSVPGRAC